MMIISKKQIIVGMTQMEMGKLKHFSSGLNSPN